MRVSVTVAAAIGVLALLWLGYRGLRDEPQTDIEKSSPSLSVAESKTDESKNARPAKAPSAQAKNPQWVRNSPTRTETTPSQLPSADQIFNQQEKTIEPKALGDAFESGERRAAPSEIVREAILLSGKRILYPVFKVCVDSGGAVAEVKVIVTSGYTTYDTTLVSQIQEWRYTPILDEDGVAIAACSSLVLPQVIH